MSTMLLDGFPRVGDLCQVSEKYTKPWVGIMLLERRAKWDPDLTCDDDFSENYKKPGSTSWTFLTIDDQDRLQIKAVWISDVRELRRLSRLDQAEG